MGIRKTNYLRLGQYKSGKPAGLEWASTYADLGLYSASPAARACVVWLSAEVTGPRLCTSSLTVTFDMTSVALTCDREIFVGVRGSSSGGHIDRVRA